MPYRAKYSYLRVYTHDQAEPVPSRDPRGMLLGLCLFVLSAGLMLGLFLIVVTKLMEGR